MSTNRRPDGARYEKRIGALVDKRWRIDELLGWGSTSAVYGATHRNGHRAALKILHRTLCGDRGISDRFLREAKIANAIRHRSIVPIRDDGVTEDGCAYLVMELLDGETLDAMRVDAGGTLSLDALAPIGEELMSALAAVHAAGVIHRDLKPHNVLVTRKGELKLLDFGTARISDPGRASPHSIQGLVIGTPAFMSPEQARGARDDVDERSDVWALGATLFTLLSGQFVHEGRDAHARLLAAATKPARSLESVTTQIDPRVCAVVDRALAFTKGDRWPDVQTMRIAFREAVLAACPTLSVIPCASVPPPPAPAPSTTAEPADAPPAPVAPARAPTLAPPSASARRSFWPLAAVAAATSLAALTAGAIDVASEHAEVRAANAAARLPPRAAAEPASPAADAGPATIDNELP